MSANSKKVQFNLFAIKKNLETSKGVEISWAEIARKSDVHANTLVNILHNKTRRIDLEVIEKLVGYFRSEGLQISIGDFFTEIQT